MVGGAVVVAGGAVVVAGGLVVDGAVDVVVGRVFATGAVVGGGAALVVDATTAGAGGVVVVAPGVVVVDEPESVVVGDCEVVVATSSLESSTLRSTPGAGMVDAANSSVEAQPSSVASQFVGSADSCGSQAVARVAAAKRTAAVLRIREPTSGTRDFGP